MLETEEFITNSELEARQAVETLLRTEIGVFCQSYELGNYASPHTALFEEMDYSIRRTLLKLRGINVTRVYQISETNWGINYTYNGAPNSISI